MNVLGNMLLKHQKSRVGTEHLLLLTFIVTHSLVPLSTGQVTGTRKMGKMAGAAGEAGGTF